MWDVESSLVFITVFAGVVGSTREFCALVHVRDYSMFPSNQSVWEKRGGEEMGAVLLVRF